MEITGTIASEAHCGFFFFFFLRNCFTKKVIYSAFKNFLAPKSMGTEAGYKHWLCS